MRGNESHKSERYQFKLRIIINLVFAIHLTLSLQETASGSSCQTLFSAVESNASFDPRLVKGVIELPDKGVISQEIFDRFSVNEIGRAIIERIRRQEAEFRDVIASVGRPKSVQLDTNSQIILFFHGEYVKSIWKEGFLNQHQVYRSSGHFNREGRLLAEDNFTGINLSNSSSALSLRPKSAFLNILEGSDLSHKFYDVSKRYGGVGAVLKNEVKNRSIWIATDSGEFGSNAGYYTDNFSGRGLAPYRGTFSRKSIPCEPSCHTYYESLVYGKIDFTDVDHFLVADRRLAEAVKPIGKPIYLIYRVERNNRLVFEKGELLYEGNIQSNLDVSK